MDYKTFDSWCAANAIMELRKGIVESTTAALRRSEEELRDFWQNHKCDHAYPEGMISHIGEKPHKWMYSYLRENESELAFVRTVKIEVPKHRDIVEFARAEACHEYDVRCNLYCNICGVILATYCPNWAEPRWIVKL